MNNKKKHYPKIIKSAFTLVETAIVLILIAFIVVAIIAGQNLIDSSRRTQAIIATQNSVVNGMEGLIFWLDAVSYDKLTFDSSNNILKWSDINPQIKNKSDAYEIALSRNPAYNIKGINKLPSIDFTGQKGMETNNQDNFNISQFSIFVVRETTNSGTIMSKNIGNLDKTRRKLQLRGSVFASGEDNDIIDFSDIVDDITDANITSIVAYANNDHKIWYNGNSNSYFNTLYHDDFNNNPLRIGGAFGGANSERVDGYIGEIIIFDRALSDAEVEDVNNYLSRKWGISLNS